MSENIDIKINVVNTKSVVKSKQELDKLGKAGSQAGQKLEKSFKGSSDAFSVFSGALGAAGIIGLFRGITSGVTSFGSAVVNEAKKIETFTTQFTTLTGSVEAAEQQIKDLQAFAASTPFQLEGIADSAKVLLSFGFQASETTDLLTKIGDVAAISGKPLKDLAVIFGQVSAAGKLTGERFNQLVESGVNVGPEIAKILNISEKAVRQAISSGQVTAEVFQQAFSNLSAEGGLAFNGMISLSQTLEGVLSTLGDNFSLIAADIGKQLLPVIKSIAIETIELAQGFRTFFVENIEEIKIFTGAIAGLAVGFGLLAVKIGLAAIGVTGLSSAFTVLGTAASAAWTLATGPVGLIIIALTAVGAGIVAITNNYKGLGEQFKLVSATVLDGLAVTLEFIAQFETGFRQVFGTIGELFLSFVDIYLAGIQQLAEVSDKLFGTDIAGSIESFRTSLDETVQSFKNGDGAVSELATKTKIYSENLRESAEAQRELRVTEEARIETLVSLRNEQEQLRQTIKTGSEEEIAASNARLAQIDLEIAKLEGRKAAEEQKKEVAITGQQQLAEINKKAAIENELLEKESNGKSLTNLQKLLEDRRLAQVKSLRDQAVKDSDFRTASLAQQELNEAEKTASLVQSKLDRQTKIDELDLEQAGIDTQKKEIEAELKLVTDEEDKEALQSKLQELEVIRLESEAKELEARGKHLAAIQKQRDADALKDKKKKRLRSDEDIRASRNKAKIDVLLEQTTSEQIIGIGDNLFKAGVIQGKKAGKVLKTLKTGEAIINTFAGANQALGSAPPPFNFILAASVIASGLANVASIQAQKFATGGIVQPGSTGRGIDTVPALLSVGEEVITANNPRHRDNISREQDDRLIDAVNGLRTDIQGMQTIVQIDGKNVADVIQEQRFRGVS